MNDLLQSGITGLQWRLVRHEVIHAIPTGVPFDEQEGTLCATKIRAALDLIAATEPRRLSRLKLDVRRILVTWVEVADAQFSPRSRTILLDLTYICKSDVTPGHVAAAIVHEAVHARLFTVGIGYPAPLRPRIERLCMREELAFAGRLSDSVSIGARARYGLTLPDEHWHPETVLQRRLALVRSWGWPEWLIRILERGSRCSAA